MKKVIDFIERVNTWVATTVSFLILVLVGVVMFEVVSRSIFHAPTQWVDEISRYLLVGVVMLGGGYCLADDAHVRVDIFYRNFGPRARSILEIITFLIVLTFTTVIIWKGGILSWEALMEGKRSNTILGLPLFPSMVLVPIGAGLLALQSFARALKAFGELTTTHVHEERI